MVCGLYSLVSNPCSAIDWMPKLQDRIGLSQHPWILEWCSAALTISDTWILCLRTLCDISGFLAQLKMMGFSFETLTKDSLRLTIIIPYPEDMRSRGNRLISLRVLANEASESGWHTRPVVASREQIPRLGVPEMSSGIMVIVQRIWSHIDRLTKVFTASWWIMIQKAITSKCIVADYIARL